MKVIGYNTIDGQPMNECPYEMSDIQDSVINVGSAACYMCKCNICRDKDRQVVVCKYEDKYNDKKKRPKNNLNTKDSAKEFMDECLKMDAIVELCQKWKEQGARLERMKIKSFIDGIL